MGFLDQMAKAAALGMAVEMSKNKKGKPDPYKAAGIAAGMGYTALSDRASLGAMLGSEGAFDDVPPDDGYEDELAYGEAEDGMEDFTPQFCSSIQPLIAWKSFVLRLPSIFSFEI